VSFFKICEISVSLEHTKCQVQALFFEDPPNLAKSRAIFGKIWHSWVRDFWRFFNFFIHDSAACLRSTLQKMTKSSTHEFWTIPKDQKMGILVFLPLSSITKITYLTFCTLNSHLDCFWNMNLTVFLLSGISHLLKSGFHNFVKMTSFSNQCAVREIQFSVIVKSLKVSINFLILSHETHKRGSLSKSTLSKSAYFRIAHPKSFWFLWGGVKFFFA